MARVQILDPQRIPVVGSDAQLPPVPSEALTAEALRRRFAAEAGWTPEIPGDTGPAGPAPTPAAVLVPLVTRAEGLQVLLTQRTDHLRDHAGQISFPGGRTEPEDRDPVDTALRETEEEIGLARSHVEVIGHLPLYATITGFVVTPVVALVRPPFHLRLDQHEVSEAFEVPLAFLMNPAHHQRHLFEADGQQRQFLSMPWSGIDAAGQARRYFVWGATASMLRNFYRFLSA